MSCKWTTVNLWLWMQSVTLWTQAAAGQHLAIIICYRLIIDQYSHLFEFIFATFLYMKAWLSHILNVSYNWKLMDFHWWAC